MSKDGQKNVAYAYNTESRCKNFLSLECVYQVMDARWKFESPSVCLLVLFTTLGPFIGVVFDFFKLSWRGEGEGEGQWQTFLLLDWECDLFKFEKCHF